MTGRVVSDADISYVKSLYPDLDIKYPTGQQEQLILYYFRGMSINAAAEEAGYKTSTTARNYLRSQSAVAILEVLRDRELTDIRINIDTITSMFMEAFQQAATSMEKIAATREIAKLHDLYPTAAKAAIQLEVINDKGDVSVKQLQRLSDEDIATMIGPEMLQLLPKARAEERGPLVIEAEVEIIEDE